jgi:hypothetical protein
MYCSPGVTNGNAGSIDGFGPESLGLDGDGDLTAPMETFELLPME